jgi:putative phosphoribosyl transferase
MELVYVDRRQAGRELALALRRLTLEQPLIVLGLPRGGVPVAAEVAIALGAPLDVLTVRKVGAPLNPEFARGAIATGGIVVRDDSAGWFAGGDAQEFERLAERERAELRRREAAYRSGHAPLDLRDRSVVLVDDGLATGSTMLAAVRAARAAGAARIVAAAPVGSAEAVERLEGEADEIVVPLVPRALRSVGEWYDEFGQVDDETVRALLRRAGSGAAAGAALGGAAR